MKSIVTRKAAWLISHSPTPDTSVVAMMLQGGATLVYRHADGRLRVSRYDSALGDRIIPLGGEEDRRLGAMLADLQAAKQEQDERGEEFDRFNAHKAFPAVAPFEEGELVRVLRKDEAGQVRRFADQVVLVSRVDGSDKKKPTRMAGFSALYMAYPKTTVVHESTTSDQAGYLVKLAHPVRLPVRVAYGLVDGDRTKPLPLPGGGMLAKGAEFPTALVDKVFMPEHWLRRLTAHERSTFNAPWAPEVPA